MARAEPALAERRAPGGVRPRAVALVGAGTAGFLLVALAVLHLVWQRSLGPQHLAAPQVFGPPALQTHEAAALRAALAAQRAAIEGYAWVDRKQGLVRVPVARAMALLAGRGEAGWDPPGAAPP